MWPQLCVLKVLFLTIKSRNVACIAGDRCASMETPASSQSWALLLQGGGSTDSAGVYVGVSYSEYAQLAAAQTSSVSTYTATGGSLSVAAGTDVSCAAFQL